MAHSLDAPILQVARGPASARSKTAGLRWCLPPEPAWPITVDHRGAPMTDVPAYVRAVAMVLPASWRQVRHVRRQ